MIIIIMWLSFTEAGDADLDNLLKELYKVGEEAAASTITLKDTGQPTRIASKYLQFSGENFSSFLRNVELSDVVHVPTLLTSYHPGNNQCRQNSQMPDDNFQDSEQMNKNVYKYGRKTSLQRIEHLSVYRRPSVASPRSPSHVCHY